MAGAARAVGSVRPPLSERLRCCAAEVMDGARVADIGCDHGYLGIHLLYDGRAAFVHACDLREQPLKRAIENALRFGVAEKMRFSRADGLRAVSPDEVDTIVCAGMGGDLIAQILSECPWVKDKKYALILQPQSSGNDLRRKLSEQGFGIERETLADEGGFLYHVICARYGNARLLTPGEQYLPTQLYQSGSPYLPRYMDRIERSLTQTVAEISRSVSAADRLRYYQTALDEVRERKCTYDNGAKHP